VRLTNTGYGASPEAQTVYGHFEWGNAYTLAELKKRFEKGDGRPDPGRRGRAQRRGRQGRDGEVAAPLAACAQLPVAGEVDGLKTARPEVC
jgi:hypothetical protein